MEPLKSNSVVIIPTYNEIENIRNIIDAVISLPKRFDILIVDDASFMRMSIKNMLAKINQSPDNEALKSALKLGLKAFTGEVKYNED